MTGFLMGFAGFRGEACGPGAPANPSTSGGRPDGCSGTNQEAGRVVLSFHERIGAGDLLRIDELFSFESAHRYWLDITTALGAPVGDEEAFRSEVLRVFGKAVLREQESSYTVSGIKTKVLGAVGSVVFTKNIKGKGRETAVATVLLEAGGWKVRTYPGVFPGEMLSQARRGAGGAHERGSQVR